MDLESKVSALTGGSGGFGPTGFVLDDDNNNKENNDTTITAGGQRRGGGRRKGRWTNRQLYNNDHGSSSNINTASASEIEEEEGAGLYGRRRRERSGDGGGGSNSISVLKRQRLFPPTTTKTTTTTTTTQSTSKTMTMSTESNQNSTPSNNNSVFVVGTSMTTSTTNHQQQQQRRPAQKQTNHDNNNDKNSSKNGGSTTSSSKTPHMKRRSIDNNTINSNNSRRSKFSTLTNNTSSSLSLFQNGSRNNTRKKSNRSSSTTGGVGGGNSSNTNSVVHIVCAVSENLAQETCIASLDAGSPISTLQVTKQGNGQTYGETLAYLEILKPHEILLNEGRKHSQLVRKIIELFQYSNNNNNHNNHDEMDNNDQQQQHSSMMATNGRQRRTGGGRGGRTADRRSFVGDNNDDDQAEDNNSRSTTRRRRRGRRGSQRRRRRDASDRYGSLSTSTVVKFISRNFFDQTKGAELLRRIAREETYDSSVVEEYILLSSSYAVLHYTQTTLGISYLKNSIYLHIHAGGNHRMCIDRSTMLQLELLVNSKTGKVRDSLIGTIDYTKTTVGSRLLRTNIMSPPTRIDTIYTRLELVQIFLSYPDFFYSILEHLSTLPDVDKMLSNIALIPKKHYMKQQQKQQNKGKKARTNDNKGSNNIIIADESLGKAPRGGGGGRGSGSGGVSLDVANERIASKGIAALVGIKTTLSALPSFATELQTQLQTLISPSDADTQVDDDAETTMTDRTSLLVGLCAGNPVKIQRHHLLRAIIYAMTQPALTTILQSVTDIFTETTTYSRNSHAMRHQECFALKCEARDIMSILRKAFLANVDDIYKKADEYAEVYGIHVTVRYSTSRGYFLAVPAEVGVDLPDVFHQPAKSGRYIHCTTEEIASLNTRAQDNVHDLLMMTHDRIQDVLDIARKHYDSVAALCDAIALLDMCHSFADIVTLSPQPWCRPLITDTNIKDPNQNMYTNNNNNNPGTNQGSGSGGAMIIRNGRFGIAIANSGLATGPEHAEYIPNDTYIPADKTFTVITGINGSGKSTYLKQVAIIVILAHCGSYVPAEQASIPVRRRLCCRIGNADDQEHNISTFMLEMKETAFICNNAANEHSLVLIDELGRATSNEDGVAIAWSVSEYLLKRKAMTFFVTHYPQLSRLSEIYPTVQNVHMEATIRQPPSQQTTIITTTTTGTGGGGGGGGDISYTHKLKTGSCRVSTDYGVELASACGWPIDVVTDGRIIQRDIESLLPDDSLCDPNSLDHQNAHIRTRAQEILSIMYNNLESLVNNNEHMYSLESLRAHLSRLHIKYVPNPGQDDNDGGGDIDAQGTGGAAMMDGMDRLLFRESRFNKWKENLLGTTSITKINNTTTTTTIEDAGRHRHHNQQRGVRSDDDHDDDDRRRETTTSSSSNNKTIHNNNDVDTNVYQQEELYGNNDEDDAVQHVGYQESTTSSVKAAATSTTDRASSSIMSDDEMSLSSSSSSSSSSASTSSSSSDSGSGSGSDNSSGSISSRSRGRSRRSDSNYSAGTGGDGGAAASSSYYYHPHHQHNNQNQRILRK